MKIFSNFLFLIFCTACELVMDYDNHIKFSNKSEIPIGLYFADLYWGGTAYPDTLLPQTNEKGIIYDIRGNTRPGIGLPRDSRDFFKTLPKDTLSIFIFHTDTLNKYPWEKVRDEYKILKRYDLSLQDIERLNYNVPYPPSPEMANMKMYPKYGK